MCGNMVEFQDLQGLIHHYYSYWWSELEVMLLGDIPYSSRRLNARWTVTHGFFARMGGFMLYVNGKPQGTHALTPDELLQFVREGSVKMPVIMEKDVEDRGKGDVVSKCVAILQLVWFVIQLVARYTQNLPVTLLEIDTVAAAILSCITYDLWWKKPKDVGRPYIVHWKSKAPPLHLANKEKGFIRRLVFLLHETRKRRPTTTTTTISSIWNTAPIIIGGVSGIAFGGIHFLGWNVLVPRHLEQILWRVASIGIFC
ncbi:hypothetical protein F4604DRAFT_1679267 [Suillus subluteus]|nr:hypothetical protein F4604DRAFT_1679267 [Suillus subluteus]